MPIFHHVRVIVDLVSTYHLHLSLVLLWLRMFFTRQLRPQTHVGDSLFIVRDHNLSSFRDRTAVLRSCTAHTTCAGLRIDELACSPFTNGNRELSQNADHVEIGRVKMLLVGSQNFGHEQKDD